MGDGQEPDDAGPLGAGDGQAHRRRDSVDVAIRIECGDPDRPAFLVAHSAGSSFGMIGGCLDRGGEARAAASRRGTRR